MKKALQVGRLSPHVALCLKMYICEDPSYFMNFSTGWCLWVLLPAFFFFFSHQPCLRRPFLYCKMKTANWTGKKQTRHSWVFIWPLSYASATLGSEAFMTCSTAMHKWESRSRHFDFRIEQLLWMYVHLFFRVYDVSDPVVLNKGIWLSSKFWVCGCVLQACALIINLAICESEGGYYMLSVLPTAIKLHRVICTRCATQL